MDRAGHGSKVAFALAMLLLMVMVVVAAASCASDVGTGTADNVTAAGSQAQPESTLEADGGRRRPVVEMPSATMAPKDPRADPGTELGRLRARHFPVWTPDFDWAFPPEVCNTAWELDSIAEPTAAGDITMLGDIATAAALAVMRYEHQLSRSLADPNPLAQMCVATASVEPARSDALDVLASYLATGVRRSEPAAYPDSVWVLAVSPTAAISVACVTPGHPAVVGADGQVIKPAQSPARLQTYRLSVSLGLEDQVTDISYRVANTAHRPAQDCEELDAWILEWDGHIQTWMSEGQIWEPLAAIVTTAAICESAPPDGPNECPRDWPQ